MRRLIKRGNHSVRDVCKRQFVVTLVAALVIQLLPSQLIAQRPSGLNQTVADRGVITIIGHRPAVRASAADPKGLERRWPERTLRFQVIAIEPTRDGGYRLLGEAKNPTPRQIHRATIAVEYLRKGEVVLREYFPWGPMRPYEERRVGLLLRPVLFDDVRMMASDVEFGPSVN